MRISDSIRLMVGVMIATAGVAVAKVAPIGTWNDPNLDGWVPGKTHPARLIKAIKKEGSDGRGCLMILIAAGWSQATATEKGKALLEKGSTVSVDVFAKESDFPHGSLKIGIGIQSDKTVFDECPAQSVKFGEWQTLTFPYDRQRHKNPRWTLLNIITISEDQGTILIDNVRVE